MQLLFTGDTTLNKYYYNKIKYSEMNRHKVDMIYIDNKIIMILIN